MKENQINSVDELKEYLKKYSQYAQEGNLFFRGQLSKYPNMLPSVARDPQDFEREATSYHEHAGSEKTVIQNLAKMQHDRTPTRLLDFTTDPLVSLFFATDHEAREDASLYIFIRPNHAADSEEVKLSAFIATQQDRDLVSVLYKFNQENHSHISLERAKQILKHGLFIHPGTVVDKDNHRMQKQKGTFALPGNEIQDGKITGVLPLENDLSYEEAVIPFEYQERIRNKLATLGYTHEKLFQEKVKPSRYHPLPGANFKHTEGRFIHKGGYAQYSETIVTSSLTTIDEMKEEGYKVAKQHGADSTRIWFRRPGFNHDNYILSQTWYTDALANRFDWTGKPYKDLLIDEDNHEGYIVYDYLQKHPDDYRFKHLPVAENARTIEFKVSFSRNNLVIHTTLISGTSLLVNYRVNGGDEHAQHILIDGKTTFVKINSDKHITKISGNVVMPIAVLQAPTIRDTYGIDYEKIKGDFIKRSDDDPFVVGDYEFSFSDADFID